MTRGWKRNHNQELWERLDVEVNDRTVYWEWVRGHSGNMGNEFVNDLAGWQAGVRADRPIFKEFIRSQSVLIEDIDQGIPMSAQEEKGQLSHLDVEGNAGMVDIGNKGETKREAIAKGRIVMSPAALTLIDQGDIKKGDVLSVARLAGIMAAKKTADLIPLCHPIPLTHIGVEFHLVHERNSIEITASVRTFSRTGVEMEALMAVSIAALTIYDMAKSVDKTMRIEDIGLKSKRGGKSGDIVLE
ncbi:cyclic pyranopterin monophosphate synthase MoaC [SAR202 cluster bacterium AD-802-E10_MRT_200m]|nr:cyclic pyranopterin monophosphate synthase MoaC [SAR202 cluster bacterium AD-802-E10_MRT_200m]